MPTTHTAYNRISCSPVCSDRVFPLYEDADNGRHSDFGPYRQPALPFAMGGWEQWQNTRLMATGDFTGNGTGDLLVVWTDGSVVLYQGSGAADPHVRSPPPSGSPPPEACGSTRTRSPDEQDGLTSASHEGRRSSCSGPARSSHKKKPRSQAMC